MINIEVFESRERGLWRLFGKPRYYTRLLYDGKPMVLPRCREVGNNWDGKAEFCTLEAFYACMDDVIVGPKE
jgi:hypothetical protein